MMDNLGRQGTGCSLCLADSLGKPFGFFLFFFFYVFPPFFSMASNLPLFTAFSIILLEITMLTNLFMALPTGF